MEKERVDARKQRMVELVKELTAAHQQFVSALGKCHQHISDGAAPSRIFAKKRFRRLVTSSCVHVAKVTTALVWQWKVEKDRAK